MQGVVDANCKFIAMCFKHSGSTNDCHAFETSSLKELNESLPFPFHWNGDPAYTLILHLISAFEMLKGVNLQQYKITQYSQISKRLLLLQYI